MSKPDHKKNAGSKSSEIDENSSVQESDDDEELKTLSNSEEVQKI
jgi:hypothetical protein